MSPLFDQNIFQSLGIHRVLEPVGSLPQPAWKLNNTPIASASETLVAVQKLHIDSASFTQIASNCHHDTECIKQRIMEIVKLRGKMHNPTTGSGGVLLGTIEQLDEDFGKRYDLTIGDRIVSLTSLSVLPLHLNRILTIYPERSEVEVEGKAIFFRSNPIAKLPDDLPQAMVVAALDVAGAPARTAMLVLPGQRVTVLGAGGTAGLLTLCAVRQQLGKTGQLVAIEYSDAALRDIASLGVADILVQGDATRPLELIECAKDAYQSAGMPPDYEADVAINVVNVPHTEIATILLTKAQGRILFFSMATSFTIAALSAEGMGREVEMQIGNGYMPDHGQVALQLLRDYPRLYTLFEQRFGTSKEV